MPEPLAPVDPNVRIPPSVARLAALADAAHAQAYGTGEPQPQPVQTPAPQPDTNQPPVATPAPQPDTNQPLAATPAPAPAPVAPTPEPEFTRAATPEELQADPFAARYNSMHGRWQQSQNTIGSLQQQLQDMGDELVRTQALLSQPRQAPTPEPEPLVTQKDVETYGQELIDVVQRAARQAVAPDLQRVEQQTRQVDQRVNQQTAQGVYHYLTEAVPNWNEINNSPEFKRWCSLRDLYSGEIRGRLLNTAFRAADAPRVIAFFKGFIADEVATGNAPVPQVNEPATPRVAAVQLSSLAAPGRAKPATGDTQVPADKPIFTRVQIAAFYNLVRKGGYNGRDADKAADEALIFAAQRDGRVRG